MNAFLHQFQIHSKSEDSDETVLRDRSTGQLLLMKEVQITTADEFRRVVETLEGQKELRNDHLLSLLDYQLSTDYTPEEGTQHKVLTFFQYSNHNLEQEIDARYKQNQLFEESQLWNILTSCTIGLAYLQQQSIGHGCVSPIDIFLSNDGAIKVVDPSITSATPFVVQDGYYYSPQALEAAARSSKAPQNFDIFRSDVFSLGVCLLHAAMLESADDCYDYPLNQINYEQIQEKLELVGQHYSELFGSFIGGMLNYDWTQRPDFIELEQQLHNILSEEQSLRESCSSLTSSWGGGYKNIVSRLVTNSSQASPAQPLLVDTGDVDISQTTGAPLGETFEGEVTDDNQEEQLKQDSFSRLVKQGLKTAFNTPSPVQPVTNYPTHSQESFTNQEPHYEQVCERVIRVNYAPRHAFVERQVQPITAQLQSHSGDYLFEPSYHSESSPRLPNAQFEGISSSNQEAEEAFFQPANPHHTPRGFPTAAEFNKISFGMVPSSSNPSEPSQQQSLYSNYSKDNLFTDPALFDLVREDVNKILSRTQRNKQNQQVN